MVQTYYLEIFLPYKKTYEEFDRLPINVDSLMKTMLISPKGWTHEDQNLLTAVLDGVPIQAEKTKELTLDEYTSDSETNEALEMDYPIIFELDRVTRRF